MKQYGLVYRSMGSRVWPSVVVWSVEYTSDGEARQSEVQGLVPAIPPASTRADT